MHGKDEEGIITLGFVIQVLVLLPGNQISSETPVSL